MALPVLRRRRDLAQLRKEAEEQALTKALESVAVALLQEEQVKKGFLNGNAAQMPGTSWSNQGGTNSRLIARVTQKLAASFGRAPEDLEASLAAQGLSWGPPFPPGRPLDPFYGYARRPRTWDFAVGENVQLLPRWNRISFGTLKALYDAYDVAQIAVRHLINDVRSLDYQFVPPTNIAEDATDDIEAAEAFFRYPDRRQPFRAWLAEYLQDVLRYDAGTLYISRDELTNRPIALEVVSGSTIIPLVDFFGRPPRDEPDEGLLRDIDEKVKDVGGVWDGTTVPAFLQIIEGLPWGWHPADDIIYQPFNPMPDSQYGLAPLEAVLLTANTDIRFQYYFLQYFTEGTIPAGFMEAPADLSDMAQVQELQSAWDALMMGDQSKLRQIRWVPAGAKFTPLRDAKFDSEFPLYLMRRVAAAFGVTPNDLGFTEDVNKAVSETQVDVQWRVGTLPLVRHLEDMINAFIAEELELKACIQFDIGREIEDRLTTAQAEQIYIQCGVLSPDEPRMRLGKRISKDHPTPRYIDNGRAGPIPLLAVNSLAGKIDPTTYGPANDQELIDHPFVSAPGAAPVLGSKGHQQAQNATAAMQDNMLVQNDDPNAPQRAIQPDGSVQTKPRTPESALGLAPTGADGKQEAKEDQAQMAKVLADAFEVIDLLVKEVTGATDNTGGPGVHPTEGVTAETGIQGEDLLDGDDDAEKELVRKWRENARHRIAKGQVPRCFEDAPAHLVDAVWPDLQHARTRDEVDAAFAALGKVPAPAGA